MEQTGVQGERTGIENRTESCSQGGRIVKEPARARAQEVTIESRIRERERDG